MATLNNPFVVYGYKGAEYFCDRQKETEKMISTLHNERNITLVAPRRMGKTGLIHHVFHQMEEQYEGVKCFYLDIFATKNLEQMVQIMASEIIGKLDTVSQSTLRKAQQVNRLRRAGMLDAFERLFISGQLGAEKPSRVFFDRCLAQLPGVRPEQCLMIGDSLTADIAGGRAAGMRTCWFDPADHGAAMPPQADWRITRLEELLDIL